jgi:hypothetical protein
MAEVFSAVIEFGREMRPHIREETARLRSA